jgi:lipopolysaccharide/colanic/teichoic acid biosynthesis glycosyltransferase
MNLDPARSSAIQTSIRPAPFCISETAERAAGFILLVAAAPVISVAALVTAMLSGQSPFVAHRRVGQNGRVLWLLKLRTMWEPGSATPGETPWVERIVADPVSADKDPSDPRVTSRWARLCRRHSIDELPQLWHVVEGEMSLVGPRPLTRSELFHYGDEVEELLAVKPGLTGLWQVKGRSVVKFPQRAALDLQMVRSAGARQYLSILLRTIPVLITGKGAW